MIAKRLRRVAFWVVLALATGSAFALVPKNPPKKNKVAPARATAKKPVAAAKKTTAKATARAVKTTKVSVAASRRGTRYRRAVYYNPWKVPTYADSSQGDVVDGEDLDVRRAAEDALGPLNGTVVAVDPRTGRILSIVNQKIAFKGGYTPCSTIKIFIGMAGLSEGVIERETIFRSARHGRLDLTEALARSDNPYFARVGEQLGFERVIYYAKLFGLGEKATLGLDREVPGRLPDAIPSDGVGIMSSFGNGINLTPLQLAAGISAIANGGTLYYLQYPQNEEELSRFVPRVKRQLEIEKFIPEIKPGMAAAVDYGTARRAGQSTDEDLMGKTGTCTDVSSPTHLGWFGSFNQSDKNQVVVVVLLTGGSPINGPVASGVAGRMFRTLSDQGYFQRERKLSPNSMISTR